MVKENKLTTRAISEIAMFVAMGFVIDELQGIISKGIFINGGAIGFAMIAVMIIGIRRGFLPALITGLLIGLLDFLTGAYILHPAQAMLDYLLPYAFVSLSAFLVPLYYRAETKSQKILWLIMIAVVGGLAKFISHYLAGVIFWADASGFAWGLNDMNPYLYSFVYNIAFIGPSIILCAGLLVVIYLKAPVLLKIAELPSIESSEKELNTSSLIVSLLAFGIGLAFFTVSIINYFKSVVPNESGFDADPDSLLITILSLIMILIGFGGLIRTYVRYDVLHFQMLQIDTICLASLIYAIARLIRMYVKGNDPYFYWTWVVASSIILLTTVSLTINLWNKKKFSNEQKEEK